MPNQMNNNGHGSAGDVFGSQGQDISTMVEHTLVQCGALLRQQLERKSKRQPHKYSPEYVDRIMREYSASIKDLKTIITQRVQAKTLAMIQQEILRVFKDALDEGEESMDEQVSAESLREPPASAQAPTAEAPRQARVAQATSPAIETKKLEELLEHIDAPEVRPTLQAAAPVAAASIQAQTKAVSAAPQPPAQKPVEVRKEIVQPAEEEIFEGTVKLLVKSSGAARPLVRFVDELRRRPQFRLLQLVGNHNQSVSIWLALRSPLRLKNVLLQMEGVCKVDTLPSVTEDDKEPLLDVQLVGDPSAN